MELFLYNRDLRHERVNYLKYLIMLRLLSDRSLQQLRLTIASEVIFYENLSTQEKIETHKLLELICVSRYTIRGIQEVSIFLLICP